MQASEARIPFSKWKPIEIMLAILFLVAPFYYHPNIGGSGLRVPNNIAAWIVVVTIIWYSFHCVLKRPNFYIPKHFIYIASFPILIAFTAFIVGVEQPLKWLSRSLFIWGGLAFLFSLFQHKLKQGRLDRLLFFVVISALILAMFGIAQIWLKGDMPDFLPVTQSGAPSSFFQQINNQATYQVTAIMIAIYLATRPYVKHSSSYISYVLLFGIACASFVVGVSGSRIGLLGLVLGLIIIVPALWERLKINKRYSLAVFIALVLGSGFGLMQGQSLLSDKSVAMQSGFSGSARLAIYDISLNLIKQKPVFGHGIGSFPRTWQYAKPGFYKSHPEGVLINGFVHHPHNEIFLWLVEGGLIAFIGLAVLLLGLAMALRQLGWQRGVTYTAIMIPIGLHTQVELPFYSSAIHWFLFVLIIMVILNSTKSSKQLVMSRVAIKFSKMSLTLLSITLIFSLVHTIQSHFDFIRFYNSRDISQTPFSTALQNPFLSEDARYIDMSSVLYSSINQNLTDGVSAYVQWAELKLLERPDAQLFLSLSDSYAYLQDKHAFCSAIEKGLLIYPRHQTLERQLERCRM